MSIIANGLQDKMSAEQKELYTFIKNCSPFSERAEQLVGTKKEVLSESRLLVRQAIEEYNKRYGDAYSEIFSNADFEVVSTKIFEEVCNEA